MDKGVNVIPIIENARELKLLQQLKNYKINVGLRYNSDFEGRLIKDEFNKARTYFVFRLSSVTNIE